MSHFTAVLCAFVIGAVAHAEDWPHIRGPPYDGTSPETGLLDSWPAEGPPVLWHIELGQGYSGLIAVGDRVYTQMQSLRGQFVVCLDAEMGREVWRRRTGWPWEPDGDWPGPMATPTFHDGRLYFVDAFGLAGCLDSDDGRLLWSLNVTETFKGRGTEYGYACSPLVEGGKVFLPVGGEGAAVVALDAADGSTVWRSGDQQASYSPAFPITVGGERQVAVFLRNSVAGFDPTTGRILWEHTWSHGYDEHAAWPIFQEPHLLTCAAFRGGATCLRLAGGSPAEVAWSSTVLSNDIFSSLVLDGFVYGFDLHDFQPRQTRTARGLFKCIELATGEERWATDRVGHANVLAADGKLILFSETGELILARVSPERYEELGRARVFEGEVCWTAPTLSRGRLYVRNHRHAACILVGAAAPARPGTSVADVREASRRAADTVDTWRRPALSAPSWEDMTRWYIACMILLGAAGVVGLLARRDWVFLVVAFVLGAAGTSAWHVGADAFVLTWPLSLFAGLQATLAVGTRGRSVWRGRAAILGFLALCGVYYAVCTRWFVVVGYGFLSGLLPAAIVGWPVALMGRRRRWLAIPLAFLAFTIFFWTSAAFIMWKTRL